MARQSRDPRLGFIAKRISGMKFLNALDLPAGELTRFHQLRLDNKLKNVQQIPGRIVGGYSVRLYCGGKSRCIAFFENDWLSACRIADMAVYLLGPRRLRYARANTADDYNFSEEQAKLDWQRETRIGELLKDVEAHLQSLGALSTGTPLPSLAELTHQIKALEAKVQILTDYFYAQTKAQP